MTCRATWVGRWPIKKGERVRLGIDFRTHGDLTDFGDSLTGTPTFTLVTAGSGVTTSAAVVAGTVASALFDATGGGVVAGDYEVNVSCGTTLGATLVRAVTLSIEG